MTVEIEAKFRVDSHDAVQERLRALGGEFIERVLEANHILDRPDGSLRRDGCGLRVRVNVPIAADSSLGGATRGERNPSAPASRKSGKPKVSGPANASGSMRAALTFKGPQQSGALKAREEYEVEVGDGVMLVEVLHRLGFETVLWYEKRRESWRLGDCRIELDEPPQLGLFVEIEGPDEECIRAVQRDLLLHDEQLIRDSYVQLLADYCREKGVADRRLPLS